MIKRLVLLFVFCAQCTEMLYSQAEEEDSVWIRDVVSRKRTLRLNPETLKAIERGTLLNLDGGLPYKDEPVLPGLRSLITKDFSEYLKPDGNSDSAYVFSIPPAVFIRQGLDAPLPADRISKAAFPDSKNVRDNARPSGQSFDDALKYLFMPSERAKMRNRKRANAWKTY
jgi:hypothetical protein